MLTYGLLLGCLGLLSWPDARSASRIRTCAATARPRRATKRPGGVWRCIPALLVPAAVAAALAGIGVAGACGSAALAVAVRKQYREHSRTKAGFVAGRQLAEALRTLVAELHAGAHPAAAAESAATEANQDTALALRTVAATARLGGDPAAVPAVGPKVPRRADAAGANAVGLIGRSWSLAHRHGLPFADVLEALRRDVEGRARFAANAHAGMAGPRASAVVLAVLPVAGLALGEAMGAGPVHLLTATSAGQLLLAAGCVLIALGLLWSARLTRSGVPL